MTSCYSVVVDLGEMRYLGEGGVPPDVLQEFILRESVIDILFEFCVSVLWKRTRVG